MFERFTDGARRVVVLAQEEASALGHDWIGTEHLLLGLVAEGDGLAASVLTEMGVDRAGAVAAVREILGSGSLSDAEALRTIGIDLDAVRDAVERSFGPGALDRPVGRRRPARRRPWRRGRRSCSRGPSSGHIPFTRRAKKALERSFREALAFRDRHIGTEHILLALAADEDGVARRVLLRLGVDPLTLRGRVLTALGRVA